MAKTKNVFPRQSEKLDEDTDEKSGFLNAMWLRDRPNSVALESRGIRSWSIFHLRAWTGGRLENRPLGGWLVWGITVQWGGGGAFV
jgi:hypothetical protein